MKVIRLSKSCISKREKNAVIKVLNKGFLGMGPVVKKFETKLSKFFSRKIRAIEFFLFLKNIYYSQICINKNQRINFDKSVSFTRLSKFL